MYCGNCGKEIEYGVPFCPYCGTNQAALTKKGFASRVMGGMTDHVESMIGGGRHVNLEFGHFFSEVSRRHTKDQAEQIFIYGTSSTTPTIQEAGYQWRRPWLYSRILAVMLLSLAALSVIWFFFGNVLMLPGIMLLGAFSTPFATLVFFYEMNVPRNISFLEMLEDFFMGGVASIALVHPLSIFIPGNGTGAFVPAMLTGLFEELAKLVIIAFVIHRSVEGRYILNGLLFGAAVGAGFASFESAGYAFGVLLKAASELSPSEASVAMTESSIIMLESSIAMMANIIMRGLLAIGGHVAWSAVTGAALSIALNRGPFTWKVLGNPKFWGLFAIPIVFHGLWDWLTLLAVIPLVLGIWVVLLVLIRRGFLEVNMLARQHSRQGMGQGHA